MPTIAVRPAIASDYDAYVPLFAELGVDDPIPSRDRFASELVLRTVVATIDDTVVGYGLYEVLADTGYIRNIATAFTHRRLGIGAALMEHLRAFFRAAGASQWCLNVKPDNVAAIALYRRFGLERAHASTALRLPSSAVLPSPPPDLVLSPLPASADEIAEPQFRLLRGQLASSRAKTGREVLGLRRDTDLRGVAVFAASIPGAFPFRLLDPADAAAMLALLRPHAPAGSTYLQVGVEDDDTLRTAVLALGAYVQLEIEHMRGTLQ